MKKQSELYGTADLITEEYRQVLANLRRDLTERLDGEKRRMRQAFEEELKTKIKPLTDKIKQIDLLLETTTARNTAPKEEKLTVTPTSEIVDEYLKTHEVFHSSQLKEYVHANLASATDQGVYSRLYYMKRYNKIERIAEKTNGWYRSLIYNPNNDNVPSAD